jgi:predicted glycosyltransferase
MKKTSGITSVETKAAFQEHLIEKFVQQNLPPKEPRKSKTSGMGGFSQGYQDIECCAAEIPVNGTIEIFIATKDPEGLRRISIPVTSRFIVFCVREEHSDYKVAWSSSLS